MKRKSKKNSELRDILYNVATCTLSYEYVKTIMRES
jgi:hypothetical protein